MHTIILVDDHPVFRQGLYHLLSKEEDLTVVGEAGDGQMAIDQVRRKRPDLVVMDINMPHLDGIEATRQILSEVPEVKVVALSVHSGKQFVRNMIQAGASGYILKESIPEEMIAGIRSVLSGDIYLSKSISKTLVSDYKTLASESTPEPDGISTPILYTKLHRPPISAAIIPRVRLLEMLENGVHHPMTLIAAPAGYGKSILASQWIEASEQPAAWVSLDENDNNLRVFLSYVIEAVQNVFSGHELKIKSLLGATNLPSMAMAANYLLNDLEKISTRFILVLDDYHHISSSKIHDFLTELLVHPSPNMHLALLTRRDPPLPLTNFRSRGLLTEINPAQLRFTVSETKSFLERFLHITITEKTAKILEEKIEGWVTGLHLAALSIRSESDQERLIDELQGTSLYIREYLFQEVLSKAPPAFNRHLIQTAILNRFCASLCDALVQSDPSQVEPQVNGWEFINWLVKMHFFIIPLDTTGRWFRYHHLFLELLQDQLKRHQRPEDIAGLHSRASDWFAQNQFFEDAIRHAVAAGDTTKAVQIVEQNRQTILNEDKWYVFETWLSFLPDNVIRQFPELLLTKTWLLYHHFNISKIPPIIDMAEALLGDSQNDLPLKGEIDFFRGYFYYFQNDGTLSLKHLTNARERVPEKNHEIYGQIEILHGLAMQMQGQQETAINRLNTLLDGPQWEKSIARTRFLATVVYIQVISGNLNQAVTVNRQLYDFSEKNNYSYAKVWSVYLAGIIHFYRNELEDAIDCFSQAIEQKLILHTRAVIDSMAGLVFAYQAIGKPDSAVGMLHSLFEFVDEVNDSAGSMIADACQARLAIIQGKQKAVFDFLQSGSPSAENMVWWLEIPAVTFCRALIFQGSAQSLKKSEATLRELLQLNQDNHNTCHMVQIMPLLALACKKQNRVEDALTLLEHAVELAIPGGWIRPFVETDPTMAELLQRLRKKNDAIDIIDRILAAFEDHKQTAVSEASHRPPVPDERPVRPSTPAQPLVEPLTNRELDVLELLAERLQNKEIADILFITIETVKGHLKNIYQKLGAKNRRQAVERAKDLNILSQKGLLE